MTDVKSLSNAIERLVEQYGLELVKAELAEMERKADMARWALTETRPYSFVLDLSSTELHSGRE